MTFMLLLQEISNWTEDSKNYEESYCHPDFFPVYLIFRFVKVVVGLLAKKQTEKTVTV